MKSVNILILAAALALFAPRAAAQGTAAYSPLHVIEGARGQAITYDPAGGPLANETASSASSTSTATTTGRPPTWSSAK